MQATAEPRINIFRHAETVKTYRAGDAIFREGDPGDLMYVVREGTVSIMVHGKVVDTIDSGGLMGEMALIDKQPRSASAVAVTDCEVVPLDERGFKELVSKVPHFAIEVMRIMAWRLRRMNESA
ncbi:MAG TPA: cyclic nucleotide-binding domain-containing protein [Candidatus Acidoferrales bacterium]|nr:cyclic nucleotide-binding domain-containing protein [Candidatus Acidoferrales bacterium]